MTEGWFNANEVEPNQAFDLIPDGWVEAVISESEKKPTAKGDGKYLKLTLTIVDERYPNRLLWDNLNLENPNQKTVQIARGTLSAICRATGVLVLRDPSGSELHNLPMLVKVGHEERNDRPGEWKNVVKGYKAKDSGGQQLSQVSTPGKTASASQQSPAKETSAPWKR